MRDGKSIKSYVKCNNFVAQKIFLMRWASNFVLGRWVIEGLRRDVSAGGVGGGGRWCVSGGEILIFLEFFSIL